MPANRTRHFTLIELLVVIAVIAILIAMLLPALARSKEMGKRVVCANNQKQVAISALSFAGDNERKLPAGQATIQPGNGSFTTYSKSNSQSYGVGTLHMEGYFDSRQSMYCPSWEHPFIQLDSVGPSGTYGGWPKSGMGGPNGHYQTAYLYRSTFGAGSINKPASLSKEDGSQPFFGDHWERRAGDSEFGAGIWVHWQEGYMIAHLDGHVKWVDDRNQTTIIAAGSAGGNITQTSHNLQENYWQSFFENQ